MLAVLKIRMTWTKENRTPEGAVLREQYCKPVRIEEDVPLLGEGIFLKECDCEQVGSQIFSNYDFAAQREKKRKISPPQDLTIIGIKEKVISMIIWDWKKGFCCHASGLLRKRTAAIASNGSTKESGSRDAAAAMRIL